MRDLQRLVQSDPDDETLVRRALGILETAFRRVSLAALADWDRSQVASRDLFPAIASMQRPSWGTWNGLLGSLRSARRRALRTATPAQRERIEGATILQRILALLDAKCSPEQADSMAPLARLCRSSTAKLRMGRLLTMPITLRNDIAHDAPSDPAWWREAATALEPLLRFHVEQDPCGRVVPEDHVASPWLIDMEGGVGAFNGIGHDFAVSFVRVADGQASKIQGREHSHEILLAFQRLLGKSDVQEKDFRAVMRRLAPEDIKGVMLGDFLVGAPVAEGGFAVVHKGTQLSTGRRVAVKILRDGMDEDTRGRFRQEAALLSRFSDPHIVSILGYGESPWRAPRAVGVQDEPWFSAFSKSAPVKAYIALEWIEGGTLDAHFPAGGERDTARITEWFAQTAAALSTLHATGLIHRDVKPANVMVTVDGSVKLMDFGIARSEDENRTIHTLTGQVFGTEAYMSPEQLRAVDAEAEVGPSTDIYSLCATFYEIYSGRRLFDHDSEPSDSVRTSKLEGRRPTHPRVHTRGLPWEIGTILMGGLEGEPADRYRSMLELEQDLGRARRDEPIRYRRPSPWRRLRLAYRRNRTVFKLSLGFALVALAGVVFYIRSINLEQQRTERQKVRAEDARDRARTAGLVEASARMQAEDPMLALLLASEAAALRDSFRATSRLREAVSGSLGRAVLRGHGDRVTTVLFSPSENHVLTAARDETCRLWTRDGRELGRVAYDSKGGVAPVFSPDGRRVLVPRPDGGVVLVEAPTGKHVRAAYEGEELRALEPVPDSELVLVAAGRRVYVVDFNLDQQRLLAPHDAPVTCVYASGADQEIVTCSESGAVYAWSPRNDRPEVLVRGPVLERLLSFHFDDTLLGRTKGGASLLIDLESGEQTAVPMRLRGYAVLPEREMWVMHDQTTGVTVHSAVGREVHLGAEGASPDFMCVSPDGERILTVNTDGSATLWGLDGTRHQTLRVKDRRIYAATFSPSGRFILTRGTERVSRLWAVTGAEIEALPSNAVSTTRIDAWSGPSDLLLTAQGNSVHVWDRNGRPVRALSGHEGVLKSVRFSRDGARVVTTAADATARIWRIAGDAQPVVIRAEGSFVDAWLSPRGDRVLTVGASGGVSVWKDDGAHVATLVARTSGSPQAHFSDDGRRLLTSSDANTARLWNADGRQLAELGLDGGDLLELRFLPGTARPVLVGTTGVRIWGEDGTEPFTLQKERTHWTGAAFAPAGTHVLTFGLPARLWDTQGGEIRALRLASPVETRGALFARDGGSFVTYGKGGETDLWDSSGAHRARLEGHPAPVRQAAFAADASRLATVDAEGTVILWDASGRRLARWSAGGADVAQLAFDASGTRLLTRLASGATHLWAVELEDLLRVARERALRPLAHGERVEYREYLGDPGPDPEVTWARRYVDVLLQGMELEDDLRRRDPGWTDSDDPEIKVLRERLLLLRDEGNTMMVERFGTDFGLRFTMDYPLEIIAKEDPETASQLRAKIYAALFILQTRMSMQVARTLLKRYRAQHGRYPTPDQGTSVLRAIATPEDLAAFLATFDHAGDVPEAERLELARRMFLADSWGRPLLLEKHGDGVRLRSTGPDRVAGTPDDVVEGRP